MIINTLDNLNIYSNVYTHLNEAVKYVVNMNPSLLTEGKNEVSENFYIVKIIGEKKADFDGVLEVHKNWIDIHIPLTDDEIIPIKYSNGAWNQPAGLITPFPNATNESSNYFASGTSNTNNPLQSSRVIGWAGLQTFSEFGGAGQTGQPLPVELVSFSGLCEDGIINLTWQTASEFNSSHFDVEKSRDGENWQLLSTIASAGTSNELISYQTADHNAIDGNNYFRLRQVDNDGKEKLYDPINVSCPEVTTGYFSSFTNPSGSAFQVIVNNKDLIGVCTLNMVDATGKVIEQREIEVKDGINMFVVNQELTPGIYFLNISNGKESSNIKIVK